MIKKILWLVLLIVGMSALVSARADIYSVQVNGDSYGPGDAIQLDKGESVDVEVTILNNGSVTEEGVQVETYIRGYDHNDLVQDISNVFNINAGRKVTKKLTIKVPSRLERDDYTLFIRVENRDQELDNSYFVLDFTEAVDKTHSLEIRDVVFSPENEIKSGRLLTATVRIKNRGTNSEEDVKVKVSIPELGISATDYVDEVDSECLDSSDEDCDDAGKTEEIPLRIPQCAQPGEYTVKTEVIYDDGDEKETYTSSILIVEDETCRAAPSSQTGGEAKTIITIGPEVQDAKVGVGAVYPVTITNAGTETRTYTVGVEGASWAAFEISPSNVAVVKSGESKALYITATAKDNALAGENSFVVTVKSNDAVLKQVGLKANVVAAAKTSDLGSIKKALMVGLLVIVVLLVILGLIIGFSKLKGSDNGSDEEKEQTYY